MNHLPGLALVVGQRDLTRSAVVEGSPLAGSDNPANRDVCVRTRGPGVQTCAGGRRENVELALAGEVGSGCPARRND